MSAPQVSDWASARAIEMLPGVTLRFETLERVLLAHITLAPGAAVPQHSHPEEQIGTVLEGSLRLELPDGAREVGAGATYGLPADVPHAAFAGPDGCVLIEAFSPPRAAWLALLEESGG